MRSRARFLDDLNPRIAGDQQYIRAASREQPDGDDADDLIDRLFERNRVGDAQALAGERRRLLLAAFAGVGLSIWAFPVI